MTLRIYTRLTVGDLRKRIDGMADHAPVLVDFDTEYDGEPTQRQGTATAVYDNGNHLLIDATQETR